MAVFANHQVVAGVTSVWSSREVKAIDAAAILTARLVVGHQHEIDLGENDRSATGYLPPDEFERTADRFFSEPECSVRGWERAVDAQRRVRDAVDRILADHKGGDVAIVSHGAVGSLLLCCYLENPISRAADQPFQGHYWQASLPAKRVLHGWRSIAPTG
ncbi:histidine phosphatase family protein [Jannaschia faecimaris]|nr:histidine phosphatase family protein [Jannaschia faecimaris]